MCWCRRSPAARRSRSRSGQLRPRAGRGEVLLLAARRRGAAVVQLHRLRLLSRGRRPDAGRAAQVGHRRPLRAAGVHVAGDDPQPLSGGRMGGPRNRHARRAGGAQGPARAARRSRPRSRPCCGRSDERRRRAGGLAAVRGLRALPLHPRRHEERHPHAVRDRLPARLRRDPDVHLRPPAHGLRPGGRGEPRLGVTVRFLTSRGERHKGEERRVELDGPARRCRSSSVACGAVCGCGWIRWTVGSGACGCACTT